MLAAFAVTLAAVLGAQSGGDAQWKAFLAWLSAQPPNSRPAQLLSPYRAELIRQGMSPSEAARTLDDLGFAVQALQYEGEAEPIGKEGE